MVSGTDRRARLVELVIEYRGGVEHPRVPKSAKPHNPRAPVDLSLPAFEHPEFDRRRLRIRTGPRADAIEDVLGGVARLEGLSVTHSFAPAVDGVRSNRRDPPPDEDLPVAGKLVDPLHLEVEDEPAGVVSIPQGPGTWISEGPIASLAGVGGVERSVGGRRGDESWRKRKRGPSPTKSCGS